MKGGLLYIGDGYSAMGDGEVAGTAIEVPLKVRLHFDVIHDMPWHIREMHLRHPDSHVFRVSQGIGE